MSFRRNSDANRRWEQWLSRNRDRLLEIGVPLIVYEDEKNWEYFLGHGYFSPEGSTPIIDVNDLTPEQALALCTFLEENESDWQFPSSARNRLQFLLARGKHAQ